MKIRKASGEEMLQLWGCRDENSATPTAKYFYRNITSGNADFWTVDNGGDLVGELYVFLNIDEDADFADGLTTAYLCAFRIEPAFRGRGLGTRLLEAALADLECRGFQYATIGVSDERNEKFYRRMGFSSTVKVSYSDPCAMDENMRPERDEDGYLLLSKEL